MYISRSSGVNLSCCTVPSCACMLIRRSLLWTCSSHRSIFSRESVPPSSESATHWPIRGRAHWFHLPLKNYFLALFGSRPAVREHSASSEERPLLPFPTDISAWKIFTEDTQQLSTSYTNESTLRLATRATCYSDTPFAATVNTFYPLKNQHTTCGTKKNLFLLRLKFTSAIRINFSLLCFKEVSLFILDYKLTYSDMETKRKH